MLIKIVSVIISFAITVTGFAYNSLSNIIDAASEMLFGIPYTIDAIKSDFFEDIKDADVIQVDSESGFVKDLLAVFVDENMSFSEKLSLFNTCGGILVGWCAPADLYVIRYAPMTYSQVLSKCEALEEKSGVALAIPVSTYKTQSDFTPNDEFDVEDESFEWDELNPSGSNWWLEAVQARQAWDYSDYFSRINIGIVDAGFDTAHPELEDRISFPSNRHARRNYADIHGTHVAGIIGASKNNEIGISGICDNSELICVDWEPDILQIWHTELAIFFGFSSLVQAGAKAVNFSLGISTSRTDDSRGFMDRVFTPAAVSLMMASLLSKGYDFVAIQSAGNGDYYGDPMDADYNGHFAAINESNVFTGFTGISADEILDRIIVVAGADNNGGGTYTQAEYTNVGSAVSVAAPGTDIYSCSTFGEYEYLSGTSMSAPIVTGIASLVWSVNSDFSGAEVKEIVCSSTEAVAAVNTSVDYYYDVELLDYPMVNAKLAVEEAIKRTDSSVGTVSGKIVGGDAAEIVFNETSHTVFSDGSYEFVAEEGSGIAKVLDSNGAEIGSFDMALTAGAETQISDYVIQGLQEEPIL